MLKLENVYKAYNTRTKIGEISFEASKGECIALCGGNGAGKSTIIKMITGQILPTGGTIWINGLKVPRLLFH